MADQAEDRSSGRHVQPSKSSNQARPLPGARGRGTRNAPRRNPIPDDLRSLATPEYSTQFFDVLRPTSAFLRSGVRTISTSNEAVIFPYLTADSTISGRVKAERSQRPTRHSRQEPQRRTSSPAASNIPTNWQTDSSPSLETVLRQALVARAGIQADIAAYQGRRRVTNPDGHGQHQRIGNVTAAAANTSIAWAGSAVAFLESGYAPRPYVYVGGTSLAKDIRQIKAGTAYDPYLFPVGCEALPSLYGAEGFLAPALAAGTAYVYSPSSCFVVNRTQTSTSRSTGHACSTATGRRCA